MRNSFAVRVVALALLVVISAAAHAVVFAVVWSTYADGSERSYVYYPEGEGAPPDAPCRSVMSYYPSWCTSASNCMAKAAPLPSVPRCSTIQEPTYP